MSTGPGPIRLSYCRPGTPIGEADAAANFTFAVGDYNRDGRADVFCLKKTNTGTNSLEVHILS